MKEDEGIATSMRVQSIDETLSQSDTKLLDSVREHGVQVSSIIIRYEINF